MGPVVFLSSSSDLNLRPELKKERVGRKFRLGLKGAVPLPDCSFVMASFDPLSNRYGQMSSFNRARFTDGGDGDSKSSGDVPRVPQLTQGCKVSSLEVSPRQRASSQPGKTSGQRSEIPL